MEQDILVATSTYLKSFVDSEKISKSDKQGLEAWLCQQIENERHGWKQKLDMSLREVERERKAAMEMFTQFQDLNSRVEEDMKSLFIISDEDIFIKQKIKESFVSDQDIKEELIFRMNLNFGSLINRWVHNI